MEDRRMIINMARVYASKNKATFASQEEFYFRSGIDFARLIGAMSPRLRTVLDRSIKEDSDESYPSN